MEITKLSVAVVFGLMIYQVNAGKITLNVKDAVIRGGSDIQGDEIKIWAKKAGVSWDFKAVSSGNYEIRALCRGKKGDRSDGIVKVDGKPAFSFKTPAPTQNRGLKEYFLGNIHLNKGKHKVTVCRANDQQGSFMILKAVTISGDGELLQQGTEILSFGKKKESLIQMGVNIGKEIEGDTNFVNKIGKPSYALIPLDETIIDGKTKFEVSYTLPDESVGKAKNERFAFVITQGCKRNDWNDGIGGLIYCGTQTNNKRHMIKFLGKTQGKPVMSEKCHLVPGQKIPISIVVDLNEYMIHMEVGDEKFSTIMPVEISMLTHIGVSITGKKGTSALFSPIKVTSLD